MRKNQYIKGINSILARCKDNYKIVIVENNGKRPTFLDNFGVDVIYTTNNHNSPYTNIGYKEMLDILEFIKRYDVKDDDFVIKITGRYHLSDPCIFFDKFEENRDIDCIIRNGASGLIGMKCKHIKNVVVPANNTVSVETCFDECSYMIEQSLKHVLPYVGINYVDHFSDNFRYH